MKKMDAGRTAALLLALALLGRAFDGISAQTLIPERIGTAEVPLSQSGSIALMSDENTACVIDSYEVRVRCVDRSGDVVGVFGREGEESGEFGSVSRLVGGLDNKVGTVDNGLDRFSVFEPSGVLVSEVVLPAAAVILVPVRRFSTTVAGISVVIDMNRTGADVTPTFSHVFFEVDMASGEVARQEVPPVEAEVECGSIIYGFPDPAGGWVHVACEAHMVFVGEDGDIAILQAPTYTGEMPTDRDVERLREATRSMGRFGGGMGREALEEYQNSPRNYHLLFGEQKFDDRGRLWIATQRDRDEFSYVDVYDTENAAFVGSVRVNDRIEGFDLLGSTLVVVVERQLSPDDADGIPDRAVDWYDVSGTR
ncbi:MAG: hypothetical protein F4123_08445 [Gemmatimonadetes bacterium]|nr:hypothetical protein [Gemmatimonadota bacterium]